MQNPEHGTDAPVLHVPSFMFLFSARAVRLRSLIEPGPSYVTEEAYSHHAAARRLAPPRVSPPPPAAVPAAQDANLPSAAADRGEGGSIFCEGDGGVRREIPSSDAATIKARLIAPPGAILYACACSLPAPCPALRCCAGDC